MVSLHTGGIRGITCICYTTFLRDKHGAHDGMLRITPLCTYLGTVARICTDITSFSNSISTHPQDGSVV